MNFSDYVKQDASIILSDLRENWPEDADRLLKEVEEYQSQGDDNE